MTAEVNTNLTLPSSKKKFRLGCMKMSGYGFPSSNLFLLNSHQGFVEVNSEFLVTGTIVGIPRKQASYWTIKWDNNPLTTQIENMILWTYVMKCDNEMIERLIEA